MTHKNVERVLGRLLTDPDVQERFVVAPERLLDELRAQGYELSTTELAALAALNSDSLRVFAAQLDRRIRRARNDENEPADRTAGPVDRGDPER